mmetsp:Transcript_33759/g.73022  ORF Transcript_33759/g.73022 Transcript_33759/m.73022 type:complete len:103 (+) Transcript_33759:32-340(+)
MNIMSLHDKDPTATEEEIDDPCLDQHRNQHGNDDIIVDVDDINKNGDTIVKDVDISVSYSVHCEPAYSSVGKGDDYSVEDEERYSIGDDDDDDDEFKSLRML